MGVWLMFGEIYFDDKENQSAYKPAMMNTTSKKAAPRFAVSFTPISL
jgi:hypothetical protein